MNKSSAKATLTMVVSVLRPLKQVLELENIDIETVLMKSQIDIDLFADDQTRIAIADVDKILCVLHKEYGLKDIGVKIARSLDIRSYDMLGVILNSCNTLRESLEFGSTYYSLLSDSKPYEIIDIDDETEVRVHVAPGKLEGISARSELVLLGIFRIAECLSGTVPDIVKIKFAHKKLISKKNFDYLNCPVHFNQEHYSIFFKKTFFDCPHPYANSVLQKALIEQLDRYKIETQGNSTLAVKVKRMLINDPLPEWPTKPEMSKRFHMSTSTFTRYLTREKTSYTTLVNEVKKDITKNILLNEDPDMNELAQQLGFSSRTAFIRAFTSWYGLPPNKYKREASSN